MSLEQLLEFMNAVKARTAGRDGDLYLTRLALSHLLDRIDLLRSCAAEMLQEGATSLSSEEEALFAHVKATIERLISDGACE